MLKPQHGFSLVELMIASLVALVTLAAVLTVYGSTLGHSTRQLREAHLSQSLQAVLGLLEADLRRAGYRHFDPVTDRLADNPFQAAGNDVRVGALPREAAASCITYSYDLDKDGLLGTGRCPAAGCPAGTDDDNVEQFGMRLRRGRIEMRYAGRRFDCRHGRWQAITGNDIEITRLRFMLDVVCLPLPPAAGTCSPDVDRQLVRSVTLSVTGRLAASAETVKRLERRVWIRNDRVVSAETPP